jgi:signal transduction histidine kinase
MRLWATLVGGRPIVTRLVMTVAAAMTVVLLASGAFVLWRVGFALDRQLDQDLDAYGTVVERSVSAGTAPPTDTPGQTFQVYDEQGAVLQGDAANRLADAETIDQVLREGPQRRDLGSVLPGDPHPYRVVLREVDSPDGPVVLATAISRAKHDEALRELLLQLTIAGLATLVAASFVGYRTARAALDPVERYRAAAELAGADEETRLPVDPDRDDELTRLGHTLNALLARIRESGEREREFLADASHELRGPLALMRAELDWVRLRPRSAEETDTSLASLAQQVERLVALSDTLLDLEELRSVGAATDERLEAAGLLTEVCDQWSQLARSLDRELRWSAEPDVSVWGRRQWLVVALGNLVSNALRHGRGRVDLTAQPEVGGSIAFEVFDEGPGFPPDFAAYAFDRFTRADESRSTPGTGLGLALVHAVAEAHGGTVAISGARVTLRFPSSGAASPDPRPDPVQVT